MHLCSYVHPWNTGTIVPGNMGYTDPYSYFKMNLKFSMHQRDASICYVCVIVLVQNMQTQEEFFLC